MTIRTRGLLVFLVSLVAGIVGYGLLFGFLSGGGRLRLPGLALGLPLFGMIVGGLEWITGTPIDQLVTGWNNLPWYVQFPVGVAGGFSLLWVAWQFLSRL